MLYEAPSTGWLLAPYFHYVFRAFLRIPNPTIHRSLAVGDAAVSGLPAR